jgi:hypothetical protein
MNQKPPLDRFSIAIHAIAVLLFILPSSACTEKKTKDANSRLAGMYKLFIIENQDSSGVWREQEWGKGGNGYIVYDGQGHMAVEISPKGYKDFVWLSEEGSIDMDSVARYVDSLSVDKLKAAVKEFSSSYVYFGNYELQDTADVIVHHRISSSIPVIWGTTVRRSFSFSGDTLILKNLNANRRLKWIKQP